MSKLSDPNLKFTIPWSAIVESLAFFRQQGQRDSEGVVLWPAVLDKTTATIQPIIIPRQITSRYSFRIPQEETFRILGELARTGMVIPIQVHSHPEEAFHSPADDKLSFVKHAGAISIVVPDFASFADEQFGDVSAFHVLTPRGLWQLVPNQSVLSRFDFVR